MNSAHPVSVATAISMRETHGAGDPSDPSNPGERTSPVATDGRAPRRRFHMLAKGVVVVGYGVMITLLQRPEPLLLLLLLLLLLSMLAVAPLRALYLPILGALIVAGGMLWAPGAAAALGIGKVVALAQLVTLFSVTTPTTDVLNALSGAATRLPGVRTLAYLLATTIAVLPATQRDVQKSVEVIILRHGSRWSLLAPGAWTDVLLDTLTRAIMRGQRLADSAIDRGYSLARGLTPLRGQRLGLGDALGALALLAPGVAIFALFALKLLG